LGFTSRIAAEPHWFGGERRLCYHLHTYGFILGELIRRVDGRQPAQFFREEIALKLGADFQIGLSRKVDLARMARPHDPTGRASFPEGSLMQRVWDSVGRADGGVGVYTSNWDFISADIPSGNGFGNGRSIAEVCAIVGAGGKLGDVRYLSENMIKEAGTEQVNEEDPFMGPMRYGLGFGLDSQYYQAPSPTSMHWGGYGGSWGLADFKARVSLGYTPNNFLTNLNGDPRHARFTAALKLCFLGSNWKRAFQVTIAVIEAMAGRA
jgi:CubicO group peptidase (beta-lactamase class C family)